MTPQEQLCEKMRVEQSAYCLWLTAQPPEEILNHAYEYSVREDIILATEEMNLTPARVRALLRRSGSAGQKQEAGQLTVGHILLDPAQRAAWRDGQRVELTAKEFDLMELLMRNPGRVYSRENLLNIVWGYEYIGDYRTVDVHIRRLREKLELDSANPEYIRTKWGVGYYLAN